MRCSRFMGELEICPAAANTTAAGIVRVTRPDPTGNQPGNLLGSV